MAGGVAAGRSAVTGQRSQEAARDGCGENSVAKPLAIIYSSSWLTEIIHKQ
jgi:hypothetical protein